LGWQNFHGFSRAKESTFVSLTKNLQGLGFEINCFKIGTPTQVDIHFVDFSKLEQQPRDDEVWHVWTHFLKNCLF
jgi:tRNA U34 5-carboxymethylaminomethyl modifying enzyme MnmG/GidA